MPNRQELNVWFLTDENELIRIPESEAKERTKKPQAKRPKKPKAKPDPTKSKHPHGNYLRYYSDGCRCDPCRIAATAYAKSVRHRPRDLSKVEHGKVNTYKHYGCRCELCGAAMKEYQSFYTRIEKPETKAKRNANRRAKRAAERAARLAATQ